MGELETDAIDKLFLELSQFTKAKTKKEIELDQRLSMWVSYASYCYSCARDGDGEPIGYPTFAERHNEMVSR